MPKRDSQRTRQRLLEAATRAFSDHGFAGAATDAIVRRARVNKRMLYHHFESKEGLFREVLAAQWQALGVRLAETLGGEPIAEGAVLSTATNALFDFLAERPEFIRLVMWEGLAGGKVSRSLWRQLRGPMAGTATAAIAMAQREGTLDPGFDPAQLLVSLLGAIAFYFAYAPTLTDLLGQAPLSATSLAQRKRHVQQLIAALK